MSDRSSRPFDHLFRDLAFALRVLVRDRGFTLTALATLALAVGATVAAFAVYRSVVLEPLAYPASDRLVSVTNGYPGAGVPEAGISVPHYLERRAEVEALEELAVFSPEGFTLGRDGELPERVDGLEVSPSFFPVLGVEAALGRTFAEEEGTLGRQRVVVLSDGLWRRLYAGDPGVLGTMLTIGGEPHEIVGVLPAGLSFEMVSDEVELAVPAAWSDDERGDGRRHSNNYAAVGRLASGASTERAEAEIAALNRRESEGVPELAEALTNAGFHTTVLSLKEDLVGDVAATLGLLAGGALLVLLIGSVNLANLSLVRGAARTKELATRAVLGARHGRVVAQLATEGAVLAATGGALGIGVGALALALVRRLGADRLPRGGEIAIDLPVVLAGLGAALLVGVVLGAVPALQLRRADLGRLLAQESRGGSAGPRATATRQALVVGQVALAFVLLVGAGLMLSSFARLAAIDPGFATRGVLTATVAMPDGRHDEPAVRLGLVERLLEGVRALPGVRTAGAVDNPPLGGGSDANVLVAEGYVPAPGESLHAPRALRVSPGWFEAAGVPLLAGRGFDRTDTDESLPVAVVDAWLAKKFWGDESPLGKRVSNDVDPGNEDGTEPRWMTIVGVVGEIKHQRLDEDPIGAVYQPIAQSTPRALTLTVATSVEPTGLVGPLGETLQGIDPALPLFDVQTQEERLGGSLATHRALMVLAAAFAALALFLAGLGVYGVLAYAVAQRRREIGIRMALGSSARQVFRLIVGQGVRVLVAGLVLGGVGAFFLARVLASVVYGVEAGEPTVLGAVVALLALVVLAASTVPGRRATRIDPGVALGD